MKAVSGLDLIKVCLKDNTVVNTVTSYVQDFSVFKKVYSLREGFNLARTFSFFKSPVFLISESKNCLKNMDFFLKSFYEGSSLVNIVINKDLLFDGEGSSNDFLNLVSAVGWNIFYPSSLEELYNSIELSKKLVSVSKIPVLIILDIEILNTISSIRLKDFTDTNSVVGFFDEFIVVGGLVRQRHKKEFMKMIEGQRINVVNYLNSRNDFFTKGFEVFGTEKDICLISIGKNTNQIKNLIVSKEIEASLVNFNRFFDLDTSSLKSELVGIKKFLIVHDSLKDDSFFVNFSKNVLGFAERIDVVNVKSLEELKVFFDESRL